MSISKKWIKQNTELVIKRYKAQDCKTIMELTKELGGSGQSIRSILENRLPSAEYAALKALRYSKSKTGPKNPMTGKFLEKHHNWKGVCSDGRGYLTILHDGRRQLAHQVIMKKALGIKELPAGFGVHHIDGNPLNNKVENLAVVTNAGHKQIHYLQAKDSFTVALRKSSLWEAMKYMTSGSKKTTATKRAGFSRIIAQNQTSRTSRKTLS